MNTNPAWQKTGSASAKRKQPLEIQTVSKADQKRFDGLMGDLHYLKKKGVSEKGVRKKGKRCQKRCQKKVSEKRKKVSEKRCQCANPRINAFDSGTGIC